MSKEIVVADCSNQPCSGDTRRGALCGVAGRCGDHLCGADRRRRDRDEQLQERAAVPHPPSQAGRRPRRRPARQRRRASQRGCGGGWRRCDRFNGREDPSRRHPHQGQRPQGRRVVADRRVGRHSQNGREALHALWLHGDGGGRDVPGDGGGEAIGVGQDPHGARHRARGYPPPGQAGRAGAEHRDHRDGGRGLLLHRADHHLARRDELRDLLRRRRGGQLQSRQHRGLLPRPPRIHGQGGLRDCGEDLDDALQELPAPPPPEHRGVLHRLRHHHRRRRP
mmetsp:Transcript_17024/g.41158  ORF Transcript_17024/g.41158 Transcript_17024/m.41158 type:complete len:280 (+) Transcript_17024:502-1341(+)